MVKCKNCKSQNFEMGVDGLFCVDCNIAVEGSVQEQSDAITSRKNAVSSSPKIKAPSPSSSVPSGTDPSDTSCTDSPGLTKNQAFNLIIFKQVSALIDLGASEKIKNVVFFIWSKYIRKCEAVSMNESETHETKVLENKKKRKGKIARNKQRAKEINAQKKVIKKIEMSLSKTLCFCYLGLLYTKDQLLLTDLLRLAKEDRVPFFNAHEIVSQRIAGYKRFSPRMVPDVHYVSLQCAKLIQFLELPKLKHRSLMPIVLRFVKDLNLPDNIVHIVKMLVDKLDLNEWYELKWKKSIRALPVYEVQAISLIIIVLKMFFVLDGEYELDHSEVSRKINTLLQDRKLFVWDRWKQQASLKEFLFMNQKFEFRKISFFDSLITSQIISKYKLFSRPSLYLYKGQVIKNHSDNRLKLAAIFNELRSRNGIPERPTPTSFPLTQSLIEFLDRGKDLPMYKETKEIDFSLLTEDFSSDLLFYLPSEKDESSQEIIDLLCSTLYIHVPDRSNLASSITLTSSNYWSNKIHKDSLNEVHAWLNNFSPSFEWLVRFLSNYIYSRCKSVYLEVVKIERKFVVKIERKFVVYKKRKVKKRKVVCKVKKTKDL